MTNLFGKVVKSRYFLAVALAAVVTIQIYDQETYTRGLLRDLRHAGAYAVMKWTADLDDAYYGPQTAAVETKKLKVAKR